MSKKTKKGPHPHDKKEQQQIAGCPRCRGKEIFTVIVPVPALGIGTITTSSESSEALAAATFVTGKTLHATDHVDAERIADENPGVLVTYPPLPDTSGLAPLEALAAASVTMSNYPAVQTSFNADYPPVTDTSGLAPLEVLPLSSVPLEAEPDKAPDAPPVAPVGFSPH